MAGLAWNQDNVSEWGNLSKFKGINKFKHIVQRNKNNGSDNLASSVHTMFE